MSRLRTADVIVLSVGKSGRTWLRVLLNKYLSLHYGVPFSIDDLHAVNPAIPSISYQHRLSPSLPKAPAWINRLLENVPLVTRRTLRRKKLVLLRRDPRDMIVSSYFQLTRRASGGTRLENTSISDYIRIPNRGIGARVRLMNQLYDMVKDLPHYHGLTYEGMKADTAGELEKLLRFMGIEPNPQHVAAAVAFSDFDNMRRMEQNREFSKAMMRPGDPADANSFKVRKGKVGGYLEHFGAADLAYLEQQIAALHPDLGYARPAAVPPGSRRSL
jgi:hypothetical protein